MTVFIREGDRDSIRGGKKKKKTFDRERRKKDTRFGSLCARRNDSSTHSYSTVVTIVAAAKCDVDIQFLCEAPSISWIN